MKKQKKNKIIMELSNHLKIGDLELDSNSATMEFLVECVIRLFKNKNIRNAIQDYRNNEKLKTMAGNSSYTG